MHYDTHKLDSTSHHGLNLARKFLTWAGKVPQ